MKELGKVYLDETGVLVYNVSEENTPLLTTALKKKEDGLRQQISEEILMYKTFMQNVFKSRDTDDARSFSRGMSDGYHHSSQIALNTDDKRRMIESIKKDLQ